MGYYVAEIIMLCLSGTAFGVAAGAAVAAIPFNVGQAVGSGVTFILLAAAMDRLDVKQRLIRI